MKAVIPILLLSVACSASAQIQAQRVANAIYRIEGGRLAKVPYGILSIHVQSRVQARRVCLNTIRHTYARWKAAGARGSFWNALADRYCPPSVDPQGNRRWKRNIRAMLRTR